MPFPEFDPAKKKVLFFSRGRGRGHAIPDIEIVKELHKLCDDIDVRFVSYATGARTLEEFGYAIVDLGQPENSSISDMTALAGRLIRWLQPDVVVSHEEFSVLPAAKIFDRPTILVTDWFIGPETYSMDALKFADEILFIGEPGVFEEPPTAAGKVEYVGPILRKFEYSLSDRSRARNELGLPDDAFVVSVLPGSWTEEMSPIFDLVIGAFDLLDAKPKRLVWLAGEDFEEIKMRCADRADVIVKERDWVIDRIMVSSDLGITKVNKKTVAELQALGVPSIAISRGHNRADDVAVRKLTGARLLQADELDASQLAVAFRAQASFEIATEEGACAAGAQRCASAIRLAMENVFSIRTE